MCSLFQERVYMFELLYSNTVLASIIIGGFAALGLSVVLLELRYKERMRLGIQPAIRRFGPGIVFLCLGVLLFCLMLLLDFNMNKTILNQWALNLAIGFVFASAFFTGITYFLAGRVLKRFWGRR